MTMTMTEVRASLIETGYYNSKQLDAASPEDLVSWYVSAVDQMNPDALEDLKKDFEWAENLLGETLKTQGHLYYDGYMGVCCSSIPRFLWECYTHFLGEGLDEEECDAERERLMKLYVEAEAVYRSGL